jgi:hypothetical protein
MENVLLCCPADRILSGAVVHAHPQAHWPGLAWPGLGGRRCAVLGWMCGLGWGWGLAAWAVLSLAGCNLQGQGCAAAVSWSWLGIGMPLGLHGCAALR